MVSFRFLDKNKISSLPKTAGVYVFKKGKEALYIGKAANIKERVKNHFQRPGFRDELFIQEATKIGYVKTNSVIEALLLEAELIKKYQPRFNVLWRDDKNYFYVAITKEDYPRVFLTHQPQNLQPPISNLQPTFVGPFVDGKALKQTLKLLRKVFPYRTCKSLPKKPCLWYQLGQCPGPCKFLYRDLKNSNNPMFKKEYQSNIKNLIQILRNQKREVLKRLKKEMRQASRDQEFEKAAKLRDQLVGLENVLAHAQVLERIPQPQLENWSSIEKTIRKILGLKTKIKRIEGYDVSNIQGKEATGSMVVFEEGEPAKSEYRKFKIKVAGKPNDILMLREVLSRRFQHQEWLFPQLIFIDGGKAQLNIANLIIKQFGNLTIKVIALAKRKNELYLENRQKPIRLDSLPNALKFLILRIRDEAHRFAISYHKTLRKKVFIGD